MTSLRPVRLASRRAISLFVNGRRIRDRSLTYAIEEAYHTLLMKGRHPVAIIGVDVHPALVDVNVHPTKNEVKFAHANLVFAAIQRAVRAALQEHADIPRIAAVRTGDTPTITPRPMERPRMDFRRMMMGGGQPPAQAKRGYFQNIAFLETLGSEGQATVTWQKGQMKKTKTFQPNMDYTYRS